jgi:hypothetical protein
MYYLPLHVNRHVDLAGAVWTNDKIKREWHSNLINTTAMPYFSLFSTFYKNSVA